MKVTVCFGSVRIVVPCGAGELLISDLIHESIRRYKKAARKDSDSCVVVHHLHSQSGILDRDDRVCDVADDRERIVASFDDSHGPDPCVPQGGGDGASGNSSVGTGSPDIFGGPPEIKYTNENISHIEVTRGNEQLSSGLGLQVRRGSEPSLHLVGVNEQWNQAYATPNQTSDPTKRWSAAPVCRSDNETPERILSNGPNNGYLSPPWSVEENEESQNEISNNFSRSGRLSMQFLGDGAGYRWMDAAERISKNPSEFSSKSLPRELKRKEPLGQAYESIREKDGELLLIVNEQGGRLGLTAIPDIDQGGLIVQAVEAKSRAEKGKLRAGDRILEINGIKLVGLSENTVQNHLRNSLSEPELRLRVIRSDKQNRRAKINDMIEVGEKPVISKVATVSPTRKMHGALVGAVSLQAANTRKLGKRIEIALKKGTHGLGFSVTTRDNPAGGDCPIYIKNILPRGAAIEDGRLKPGDRLLEVDNIPMTGKTQTDVVGILRATQQGATVIIVVSRQHELAEIEEREIACRTFNEQDNTPPKPPPPVLPRNKAKTKLNDTSINIMHTNEHNQSDMENISMSSSNVVFPWRNREIVTLHIPVHDTEKAGLGVSVKGKTGSNTSGGSNNSKNDGDLGIFIKSVINGGAASRDGRLKMNDQLMSVNGISLLGQSNAEAMETLRRAMLHTGGNYPGMITLSIARRISRSNSSDVLDTDNSNTSDKSGATVIYLHPEHKTDESDLKTASFTNNSKNLRNTQTTNKRWSNPVLDRLTGGRGNITNPNTNRPSPAMTQGLRNESYYMATNDNWSPTINLNENNSVLIEEDSEPSSPALPFRSTVNPAVKMSSSSTPNIDAAYSSQLSLDTHPPIDAFSRDAIGRRSISEKHHAALDAKETGTYQRNKKLREEREMDQRGGISSGSVESLSRGIKNSNELSLEARDNVGELGPSLGMKKSSSLESLQTLVQEIQMSDEVRGPNALRTPRGRGREESLRAAVEQPPESQPRKHWLLEEGPNDSEGGFINRNSPFQSSLNDGKQKIRHKKPSILKGIGHMFRFGKHRKDGVTPTETLSDFGGVNHSVYDSIKFQTLPKPPIQQQQPLLQQQQQQHQHAQPQAHLQNNINMLPNDRQNGPPMYQPPPPVSNGGINKRDVFNHRYSHYVNYEELQQQISRRHQHYHSQRVSRNDSSHHQQRPASSYYEYETLPQCNQRKPSTSSTTSPLQWGPAMARNRGPFVTQVTIRDQNNHKNSQPASQV